MLPELRDQIQEAARLSGRSMNAEIVARLQSTFQTTLQVVAPVPIVSGRAGPSEEFKASIVKMVNDAIDERIEIEKQAQAAAGQTRPKKSR